MSNTRQRFLNNLSEIGIELETILRCPERAHPVVWSAGSALSEVPNHNRWEALFILFRASSSNRSSSLLLGSPPSSPDPDPTGEAPAWKEENEVLEGLKARRKNRKSR